MSATQPPLPGLGEPPVEMANDSTGYLGYTTWPGGFGSSRTHRSWDDTVRSLGPLALRDDWQAMTEDQDVP